MILGVSHIAATVPVIDPVAASLRRFGFHMDFIAKDIANPPEKKPFLNAYSETHTLVFMKGNLNAVGLELIQYHRIETESNGNIKPAFDVYLHIPGTQSDFLNDKSLQNPLLQSFSLVPSRSKTCIHQICFPSEDLEQSQDFWCGILGFRISDSSSGEITIQPSLPMPNWQLVVKISRVEKGCLHLRKLDDLGANLISLISTNIESDRKNILDFGSFSLTKVFPFLVNNKKLKLCLGYSPEGQVLEFLEAESEVQK